MNAASPTTSTTARPIPSLTMLGYGYDLFKSPYCSDEACTQLLLNGLDSDSPSHEIQLPNWHGSFQCPSIVRVLSEQVQNDNYSFFADTVEEYTSELSVKASVSGAYGAFSGSVESSYKGSTSSYLDNRYGEYGHIFSGIKLALPHTAAQLRALLNPEVKQKLLSKDPQELIAMYGTHLVTGLVVGAKARLLQCASRSEVTSKEEFATAVKAQYASVTASVLVETKNSETIKKLQMASEVHTLGGGNVVICSPDDFKTWLKSVHDVPAIIDMTSFVPLYQLLDPVADRTAREALKNSILRYAKRFHPGALYGTSQQLNNYSSSGTWIDAGSNGNQLGRHNVVAGVLAWSNQYQQGNSLLGFWQATGAEAADSSEPPQGMAIYGGIQQQSSYDSSHPLKQMSSWGTNTHPQTNAPLQEWPAFSGFANHPSYGDMGMSFVKLFVGPIEDAPHGGFIAVGGKTVWEDDTAPAHWGLQSTGLIKAQPIAKLKAWRSGGFADCTVYLHLSPVQQSIPEVPEG
jgi:hypothetical protein